MFKEVIFWCEFPNRVNWDRVNKIDFNTEVYLAVKNKKEFLKFKKNIKNKNIKVGAWPVLDKKDGYWFSGFCSKMAIDKLDEFKGLNIKIDIEPPIIKGSGNFITMLRYFLKYLFSKGKNNDYLAKKINSLNNKKVIISPIAPKFLMRKYVGEIKDKKNFYYNHIFYTSMIPKIFRPLFRFLYKLWFMGKDTRKVYFALGCLDVGIYGSEGIYKNINEFEKDLNYVKKLGIDKIVVFHLSGLFNKKDYKEWLRVVKL